MADEAKVARIARHILEGHERRRRFERLRGELARALTSIERSAVSAAALR